jgi:integrase/recombinase XerD
MLSSRLLEVLRCWFRSQHPAGHSPKTAPEDWLFPGWRQGRHMNAASLQTVCREAARAAGIGKRVTVHTLRHSFSTHLLENGAGIRVIQVLPGHSRIETTARYTQVSPPLVAATASPLDNLDRNARKGRK